MNTNQPSAQSALAELKRMRDELRDCIQRAQAALERTESLIRAAQDGGGEPGSDSKLPPPE